MTKAAYVTFDQVNQFSGAGKVCYHEIAALKETTDVIQVITKDEIGIVIDKYYPFSPFTYDYFASLLLKEKVDFLHLSCSPANAILAKVQPKRFVTNCPAHALEESIREHEELTGEPYPYAHNTDPYLRDALWRHLKEADAVITPSNASRDWIRDNIKPKRIVVIPHGVTMPDKPCYPTEFGNVGYIGAWGPDKGVGYLVRAWSELNYLDSTLIFFGGESDRAAEPLRKFATGGKYHLYGRFESLDEVMSKFSILVHPSVSEGYGMTVPEAMSYGKIVVASTGAGSAMSITNGVDGFTFPPRDIQRLKEILEELKHNFDKYRRVGVNARETAKTLTWSKVKEQYQKLYEEILK